MRIEHSDQITMSRDELYELVYQAAGAATAPLMEDHPDYVFPSERVKDNVDRVMQEKTGLSDSPLDTIELEEV